MGSSHWRLHPHIDAVKTCENSERQFLRVNLTKNWRDEIWQDLWDIWYNQRIKIFCQSLQSRSSSRRRSQSKRQQRPVGLYFSIFVNSVCKCFFPSHWRFQFLRFQANPFQSNEQKQLFVSSLQIFHIFRISFSSRSSPIWSVATASWWKTSSSIPPCFMLCSWFCRFFRCLTLTLFLHVFPHLSGEVVRCC